MVKKIAVFFIFSIFLVLASGCETVKGMGEGFAKDVKGFSCSMQKADDWMRKNLW